MAKARLVEPMHKRLMPDTVTMMSWRVEEGGEGVEEGWKRGGKRVKEGWRRGG